MRSITTPRRRFKHFAINIILITNDNCLFICFNFYKNIFYIYSFGKSANPVLELFVCFLKHSVP